MPTLIELATQLVTAQTSSAAMSTEEIVSSLTRIHGTLGQLESGATANPVRVTTDPGLTVKNAFKKNEIICMICGKSFKMLANHINKTHGVAPREYRKMFDIPKDQPLLSKSYSDTVRARDAKGNFTKGPRNAGNAPAKQVPALKNTAPGNAPLQARKVGRPRKTAASAVVE